MGKLLYKEKLMLTINFICDTHFTHVTPSSRKDNYPETIIFKHRQIPEVAPADLHIYAGDVFHRSVLPLKYVNRVVKEMRDLQSKYGFRSLAVFGNHDCLYSNVEYGESSAVS